IRLEMAEGISAGIPDPWSRESGVDLSLTVQHRRLKRSKYEISAKERAEGSEDNQRSHATTHHSRWSNRAVLDSYEATPLMVPGSSGVISRTECLRAL